MEDVYVTFFDPFDWITDPSLFFTPGWRDTMSTKTGKLYFSKVEDPNKEEVAAIYIRPSLSYQGRIFFRVPNGRGNGVYISQAEAEMLERQLYLARTEAAKPLPEQKLEVTYVDGSTERYIPTHRKGKRVKSIRVL